MFSKNKTRFHWLATESAPRHFPMRIIEGVFYYKGEDRGLYVPTAASIGYSWGEGESVHVVGEDFKPLPDRIDIRFYSFFENQLYQGSFDLPYDRFLSLFKEGVERNQELPVYQDIIVGVAPGGTVVVWAGGAETREVFFGKAEPYDDEMRNPLGSLIEDREAYALSYLEDLPTEIYQRIQREGVPFESWSHRYRMKYRWGPTFSNGATVQSMSYGFFNGESYNLNLLQEGDPADLNPLPLVTGFTAKFSGDPTDYVYSIRFEEHELYEAFSHLGSGGETIYMEFDPRLPKRDSRVWLHNGQESVELKRLSIRE